MSDTPDVPGWGQAGGAWTPAESPPTFDAVPVSGPVSPPAGIPSIDAVVPVGAPLPKLTPIPVPELTVRPTFPATSDQRPEAGPMYPDLFSQALAGSSLANVVTVNYADGEARPGLDVPMSVGFASEQTLGDPVLVGASARVPAEIGAFTGASAKKRWRILR